MKYTGDLHYIENFVKTIKYYFIATEPDYNIYEIYPQQIEGNNDQSYFVKEEYIGRESYYTIKLEKDLSKECTYNCKFYLKLTTTDCVTCKYNFSISDNMKTCYDNDRMESTFIQTTEIITEKVTEETTEKITDITTSFNGINENLQITQIIQDEEKCTRDVIINNKCSQGSMTEEQITQLYSELKENLLTDYDGKNKIIQTENVVFQISTLDDQKNMDNPDVSSINLGDCEKELKKHKGIPEEMSLIVFKTDIKTEKKKIQKREINNKYILRKN